MGAGAAQPCLGGGTYGSAVTSQQNAMGGGTAGCAGTPQGADLSSGATTGSFGTYYGCIGGNGMLRPSGTVATSGIAARCATSVCA